MDFSIYTYGMIGLTTVIISIATIIDYNNNPINSVSVEEKNNIEIDENKTNVGGKKNNVRSQSRQRATKKNTNRTYS
jgi:hypothetical protein